jgi:hypothetical protein
MRTNKCHMILVGFCFGIFKDLLGHQVTAQDISRHGKLQRLVENFGGAGFAGAVDAFFDITGSGPACIDYYRILRVFLFDLRRAVTSPPFNPGSWTSSIIRSGRILARCLIDGFLTRGAVNDFIAQAF